MRSGSPLWTGHALRCSIHCFKRLPRSLLKMSQDHPASFISITFLAPLAVSHLHFGKDLAGDGEEECPQDSRFSSCGDCRVCPTDLHSYPSNPVPLSSSESTFIYSPLAHTPCLITGRTDYSTTWNGSGDGCLGSREAVHWFGQGHRANQCGAKVKGKICWLTSVITAGFYCDFWLDSPESLVLKESVLLFDKNETENLRELGNLWILPKISFHLFLRMILYRNCCFFQRLPPFKMVLFWNPLQRKW